MRDQVLFGAPHPPPPHTPFPSSQTTDSTGTMYFSSYSTRNTNRKRTSQAAKG
jgi:hypothetical protein